jgi:predicted RNase H-like HicB family nuclease
LRFTKAEDSTRLFKQVNATIKVEQDEETGVFVASWDDPSGGGITTQADTLEELDGAVREAIRCHFSGVSGARMRGAIREVIDWRG